MTFKPGQVVQVTPDCEHLFVRRCLAEVTSVKTGMLQVCILTPRENQSEPAGCFLLLPFDAVAELADGQAPFPFGGV